MSNNVWVVFWFLVGFCGTDLYHHLISPKTSLAQEAYQKISQCESTLPRNKSCQIIAIEKKGE